MTGLLLAAILLAETLPAPALVGLWESEKTSKGGIGHTLEFRSDGTYVEAVTVIVDLHYRLVGDRLVMGEQPPAADADSRNSSQIGIDGDVILETGPDASVVRKERLGRPEEGKPAIVGVWRYRHYTGAIAFERYTADGRFLFRLPMSSSSGRYALNQRELVLSRSRHQSLQVEVEVRGDKLLYSESRNPAKVVTYRRESAGAWYERGPIDYQPPK